MSFLVRHFLLFPAEHPPSPLLIVIPDLWAKITLVLFLPQNSHTLNYQYPWYKQGTTCTGKYNTLINHTLTYFQGKNIFLEARHTNCRLRLNVNIIQFLRYLIIKQTLKIQCNSMVQVITKQTIFICVINFHLSCSSITTWSFLFSSPSIWSWFVSWRIIFSCTNTTEMLVMYLPYFLLLHVHDLTYLIYSHPPLLQSYMHCKY